jgi:hypothetical protein
MLRRKEKVSLLMYAQGRGGHFTAHVQLAELL